MVVLTGWLMLSLLLCSCSASTDIEILSTAVSQINMKERNHVEQLNDYDTPYTICYKNKDDTYSLYIFASPIQYKTDNNKYAIIDNTVIESQSDEFAFENKANNVKTYFPNILSDMFLVENGSNYLEFKPRWNVEDFSEGRITLFTNMFGDTVSAVVYSHKDMDLVFYPTKSGIKTEVVFKRKPSKSELSFTVRSNASSFENKQNGYILFKNGVMNQSIIYQPIVQYDTNNSQQMDITSKMNIIKEEEDYHATVTINDCILNDPDTKYPISIDMSFELYLNKMPDSTIYSKRYVNNYLANYAMIGNHPVLGEGWHYIRYRLNHFFHADGKDIESATYYVRSLYSSDDSISTSLYRAEAQWSSTGIIWSDRINGTEQVSDTVKRGKNYLSFQINSYVKDCIEFYSWETETIGVLMKSESPGNSYEILATSDNSLYSPYILIKLKKLPDSFEKKENINNNMN